MENITDADILHYIDSLLKKTNGMNRKEILSQHPYEIWLGADGRWWTYLPDKDHPNNRRPLARKVRENLEDGIVDFYKQKKRLVSVALKDFYPEWFCYKESMKISSGTLRRYDQYWAKYYEGGTMAAMPLQDLDSVYLTKWAHDTIEKFNMSSKEFNNMKIILTGSLKLAKKKHVLSVNPWEDVEINSKSFRVVHKKPSNTQVFLDDEIPSLVKEIQDDLIRHPYRTDALAVCLDSQLGLRIGELVALKWTDREDAYIRIQRMESKIEHRLADGTWGKSTYEVVEYTKTHETGERLLYLTDMAKQVLDLVYEINQRYGYDSEYIFCDENGRTNSRSIADKLERYCKHMGIPTKSSHKVRKTVASFLNASGLPLDEIRKILGHTDTRTTLGYIFNPFSDKRTEKIISSALIVPFEQPGRVIKSNQA